MKKIIAGLFAGLILTMGAQALAYGCEGGVCELPQGDSGGAYLYDDDDSYCYGDGSYCYDDDDAYCGGNDGACWYDDDDSYCYDDDDAYCRGNDGACRYDDDSYCRDNDDTYCYGDRTCGRGGWHRR